MDGTKIGSQGDPDQCKSIQNIKTIIAAHCSPDRPVFIENN
jgi:hypothetical protein